MIIVLLLVCGCASREEIQWEESSGCQVSVTEDLLLRSADLILSGELIEEKSPYYSDPEGNKKQEDGSAVLNAKVTEYVVKVDTVYKGKWSEKTVSFKIYSDHELAGGVWTPPKGKCLLALSLFDAKAFGDTDGYMVTFDNAGYFVPEEDGLYANLVIGSNHFTIDPTTLPDKIAALE